jgi:hypothetical protein
MFHAWTTHPSTLDPDFRRGAYGALACSSAALLAFYLFAMAHAYRPAGGATMASARAQLSPTPVASVGHSVRAATALPCRLSDD